MEVRDGSGTLADGKGVSVPVLPRGRSDLCRRLTGAARQPQERIRTSVSATSTAAATAAQISNFGRPVVAGAVPNVLPQWGQDVESGLRLLPQSPQRISTARQ